MYNWRANRKRIKGILPFGKKIKEKTLTDGERIKLREVYLQIFGRDSYNRCEKWDCLLETYFELKVLTDKQLKDMSTKKFKLKKDKLIDTLMSSTAPNGQYTAANMTDEIAIQLLRKHSGYIDYFEEYPKNWREVVSGKAKPVQEKKAEAPKVEAPKTEDPVEDGMKEAEATLNEYKDKLGSIKGIGEASVKKVIDQFPTSEELLKEIKSPIPLPFDNRLNAALNKAYAE